MSAITTASKTKPAPASGSSAPASTARAKRRNGGSMGWDKGGGTGYAELQCTTNFGFLRGASHPGELVLAAKALGLAAIGVCDRNSLAGVVRAHAKAKEIGIKF